MQYGLIVYLDTPNLGDDIQSYACECFLPHTDYLVDREHMDAFCSSNGEEVGVLLAGWYLYMHINWPPSPFIRPLAVSMHFDTYYSWIAGEIITKNFVFEDYGGEWLKRHGPVGCRDWETEELLQQYGIPAYFSGCMTLTLRPFSTAQRHGKICLVDVNERIGNYICDRAETECIYLTHVIEEKHKTWEEHRTNVEKRLKFYQGASLVVTTRLHAALPCLALGVPVLFLSEEWALNRTATWLKFLHHTTEEDLVTGKYRYDFNHPLMNKQNYKKLSESLAKRCEEFIASCEVSDDVKRYDVDTFLEERKMVEKMQKLFMRRINKYDRALRGELMMGYDRECNHTNLQSGNLS